MVEGDDSEYHKKICLLGDPAVGKTSLIQRYVLNTFDEKYLSTIGTKVSTKYIDIYIPEPGRNIRFKLFIWDIAGQKTFSDVRASYYRGAEGAIIVCDLTNHASLKNLPEWIYRFQEVARGAPFVIVGNKSDLRREYEVTPEELERLADGYGVPWAVTSAKTGEEVENTFQKLAMAMGKQLVGAAEEVKIAYEGYSYLVKEDKLDRSIIIFTDFIQKGHEGLCIVRSHPDKIREKHEEVRDVRLVWLTNTETPQEHISSNLSKIAHLVKQFIDTAERPVVLLEGLEFLITNNDFLTVLKFVQTLNSYIQSEKACLIVPLDPHTLDDREFSLLAREMSVIEK
jgi:small GTP-binding protein